MTSPFGLYDEKFRNRTTEPIAYIIRDGQRHPVFGLFADQQGTAPALVIDSCIIYTDGKSVVDLMQADDDYPGSDLVHGIPLRKYHDLVQYITVGYEP